MTRAHLTDRSNEHIRPAWWAAGFVACVVLWAIILEGIL